MNIIKRIKEYFFRTRELTPLEKELLRRSIEIKEDIKELKLVGNGTVKFKRQSKIGTSNN